MPKILISAAGIGGATMLIGFPAQAAAIDGAALPLLWGIPFAGILLSIALLPLLAPHFWHHHYGKVAAFWAFAFLVPFAIHDSIGSAAHVVLEVALHEYLPFTILLLSLFTIAGGVRIVGNLHGSPSLNTGLLAAGTILASWMGTTGAAMLLIRPLIRANDNRRHNTHVVIFFIFLVANVGGALTPLGDPPLFLGFLKGVRFFWTMEAMFAPTLVISTILLVMFYLIDRYLYVKEGVTRDPTPDTSVRLEGGINILLLAGVVGAVLLSGSWHPGFSFHVAGIEVLPQNLARDAILLALAGLSLLLTSKHSREANGFNWEPIREVAKLFAGIFVTIVPVIAILRAGTEGALGDIIRLATDESGAPRNEMYFWLTGLLSGFLDNAPTYLVFFNMAGGDAAALMGPMAVTLLAISMGAVYMGALTYIGNAPNFMVKAIAEQSGVRMPSFFGYMAWSVPILLPVFALVTWLWLL
ncbi:MAG TPA: sodium:proton antiporter [Ferrovibrio sp.]|jgi:Na+/H+ antiporter NhaD/arsenite permease-like protein|uniref:sodium:proton antiporter n=1 Tax=Ferrovibrio sp. TaxID=1917215 RepID=UPI002B4B5A1C|nr:sodium:proton antiporter [Ferrovibrio sp.]HLT76566.1 sodium:proton antiporter [Ferrovibrio sp.]